MCSTILSVSTMGGETHGKRQHIRLCRGYLFMVVLFEVRWEADGVLVQSFVQKNHVGVEIPHDVLLYFVKNSLRSLLFGNKSNDWCRICNSFGHCIIHINPTSRNNPQSIIVHIFDHKSFLGPIDIDNNSDMSCTCISSLRTWNDNNCTNAWFWCDSKSSSSCFIISQFCIPMPWFVLSAFWDKGESPWWFDCSISRTKSCSKSVPNSWWICPLWNNMLIIGFNWLCWTILSSLVWSLWCHLF